MVQTGKDIKTKHTIKDIKLLDKAASGTAHVKNAFIKSKDAAEDTQQATHSTAEGYATDKMTGAAKSTAQETAGRAKDFFRNPRQKAKRNVEKAKEHFAEVRRQTPEARKEEARQTKQAAEHAKKTADTLKGRADTARKTAEQAQKSLTEAKSAL
ncbi:MAG: hypothetical protein LBJ12_09905, partial [Oscillospiraceae bacterium]|nr:hypothetical protein [Oscillospiraceae bacterium]